MRARASIRRHPSPRPLGGGRLAATRRLRAPGRARLRRPPRRTRSSACAPRAGDEVRVRHADVPTRPPARPTPDRAGLMADFRSGIARAPPGGTPRTCRYRIGAAHRGRADPSAVPPSGPWSSSMSAGGWGSSESPASCRPSTERAYVSLLIASRRSPRGHDPPPRRLQRFGPAPRRRRCGPWRRPSPRSRRDHWHNVSISL